MNADTAARFRQDGIVWLRGAFGPEQARFLREMVWRHIENTTPVRLDDPTSWEYEGNFGMRPVEQQEAWQSVHRCEPLLQALDSIFGHGRWSPPGPPQILLTFPNQEPWRLPDGWHIDFGGAEPTWPVFAVKMFALVDDIEPSGGGTLLLQGSHRLVERWATEHGSPVDPWDDDRSLLKAIPDLNQMLNGVGTRQALEQPLDALGIDLTPVEITGTAGDIVLTHMHVFHSPAPNTTNRPRQMIGNAIRAMAA